MSLKDITDALTSVKTIGASPIISQGNTISSYPREASTSSKHLGTFRIEKIENGFLIIFLATPSDSGKTIYAEKADKIGEAVTTAIVGQRLNGN